MSDIVIVGGGAAGMMAAIFAAERLGDGSRVTLLEKNDRLGRKIYLTGKGRCNITNMRPWNEFSRHIHPEPKFFKPAFRAFSNEAVRNFFESAGLPVAEEQGRRLFPASMKASDVVRTLERRVKESGIRTVFNTGWDSSIPCKALIIATGGKSYPITGSTGDGYDIARSFGHTVTRIFPSLTALMPGEYRYYGTIELKNVALTLQVDKDVVQREEGEMSFTDDGIEGALGYRLSRRAVWALENGQKVTLLLDLKPALTEEQLAARILRETSSMGGKFSVAQILRRLLPLDLVPTFMDAHKGISLDNIPSALKDWRFPIVSCKGYERAVVTAGGVSLKEINPSTMESRLYPGLFFAGEVMDIDGDTGGYNLQVAFSTGALAGSSAADYLLSRQ